MLSLIKSIKTNFRILIEQNYNTNRSEYIKLENILIRDKEIFEGLQDIYPQNELIFKTFDFFNIVIYQ